MIKMKKIFYAALITALCLISAMFAGCNSAPAEMDSGNGTATVSDESEYDDNDARKIELSGDSKDEFIAEYACYAEGEQVVLYFQNGVRVKGDMLEIAESVMADIAEVSGLSFDKNHEPAGGYTSFLSLYNMEQFDDVNADHKKINIYIVELGNAIQVTIDNSIIVESSDFYYEETSYQTLYHELAHVVHLRNGVSVGSTLAEGYAECIAYEAMKKNKIATWNMIQYFGENNLFDESIIYNGESAFEHIFEISDYNYQYGVRFMTFLFEKYGDRIFIEILNDATSRGYDDSYLVGDSDDRNADCEMLKEIIKANTSEDVFERFADWYTENWQLHKNKYNEYMNAIGMDMPF